MKRKGRQPLYIYSMSRNKKVFLIFAVVFFMLLFYASYDISKRTTFPGSKPQLKERLQKNHEKTDSVKQEDKLLKDELRGS